MNTTETKTKCTNLLYKICPELMDSPDLFYDIRDRIVESKNEIMESVEW